MSDSSETYLPESIAATPETSPLADSRDDGVCIIPKGVRVVTTLPPKDGSLPAWIL